MNIIEDILQKLEFTGNFNLDKNQDYFKVENFGISEGIDSNNRFIKKHQYLSRQSDEFWRSLDLFIRDNKETEVLSIINDCFKQNNIDEIPDSVLSSEDILHRVDINKNYKISFVKNKGSLVVQIINFYTA